MRVVDRGVLLVHADATKQFLDALAGVADPEKKKRKTICALFIDVFEAAAKKIGGAQSWRRTRSTPT